MCLLFFDITINFQGYPCSREKSKIDIRIKSKKRIIKPAVKKEGRNENSIRKMESNSSYVLVNEVRTQGILALPCITHRN